MLLCSDDCLSGTSPEYFTWWTAVMTKASCITESNDPECFASCIPHFSLWSEAQSCKSGLSFASERQTKGEKRRALTDRWNLSFSDALASFCFFFFFSLPLSGRLVSALFFPPSDACKVQQSFGFNRKQRRRCRVVNSAEAWVAVIGYQQVGLVHFDFSELIMTLKQWSCHHIALFF